MLWNKCVCLVLQNCVDPAAVLGFNLTALDDWRVNVFREVVLNSIPTDK